MDWGAPFQWLIDNLVQLLRDFGLWVWDGLLSVVDAVLFAFPASFFHGLSPLSTIPADILGLFGYVGGWTALGILGGAYVLRIPLGFFLR